MSVSVSRVAEAPAVPEVRFNRQVFAAVGEFYCRIFHRAISRPVGGKYRCWKCLREFELDW
jgi:hypothetical protein